MNASKDFSPRFAVFGDMGNVNAVCFYNNKLSIFYSLCKLILSTFLKKSLTSLQEETVLGYYDAILHVGDFAYDMNSVSFICS
jgi:acid phosphatase type 7